MNLVQEPALLFSSAAVVVPNPHERKGTEWFFYTANVIQDASTLKDLEKNEDFITHEPLPVTSF